MDLINLDIWLYFLINHGSANALFDVIMPALSQKGYLLALPFGAYIIALALRQPPEKRREELYYAVWTIVIAVVSFIVADWVTNEIKYVIERIRPCNALEGVMLRGGCSKSFSMPSGHATNSFAYAVALFIMAKGRVSLPWRIYPLVLAALVAYSRPYLGVHYPGDVTAGAVVGGLSAITMVTLFRFAGARYRARPYATVFFGLLIATGVFRFYHILRGPLDLSYEEAFNRLPMIVSDPLGLATGPLTSWLIAAGSALFGDTVFGIRVFALILSLPSLYLIFRLVKEMYHDEAAALWAAVLLMVVPVFSISGVTFTFETPLVFFWILSLFLFYRAAGIEDKTSAPRIWIFLGVSMGLGLLTSYLMLFFYIGMLIALIMSDRKCLLKTAGPYISIAIGLCAVLLLNLADGRTMIVDAGEAVHSATGLMQFVRRQAVIITPVMLCLIFYALHRLFYGDKGFRSTYLFAFSIPVLIFSFITCMLVSRQPGLAITGYLTGLIAVAAFFFRADEELPLTSGMKMLRRVVVCVAVAMALLVTAISHFPAINKLSPEFDPVTELRGWRELGAEVGALAGEYKKEGPAQIISDSCGIAAELAFYVKGNAIISCIDSAGRHIALGRAKTHSSQPDRTAAYGGAAIIVTAGSGVMPSAMDNSCERVREKKISLAHKGRQFKSYSAFICYNFIEMQGGPSK
jgi:membrane-associated phospholipid phosphatase